jgi:hypothetical protein
MRWDGVGVRTITHPPGTVAQTPSTACARRQRTGCAQKPPFPLARRPHNGLKGCAGSLEGAAQPPDRRALRCRIPKKTNQLPSVGSGAAEQWAQRGTPSKARRTPRSPIYGCWRSAPEGRPERIRACYCSHQMALSQSPTLSRPTAGSDQKKGAPGLWSVTPRRVHRALARVRDPCDIDSRRDQHHLRSAPIAEQHPTHWRRRP